MCSSCPGFSDWVQSFSCGTNKISIETWNAEGVVITSSLGVHLKTSLDVVPIENNVTIDPMLRLFLQTWHHRMDGDPVSNASLFPACLSLPICKSRCDFSGCVSAHIWLSERSFLTTGRVWAWLPSDPAAPHTYRPRPRGSVWACWPESGRVSRGWWAVLCGCLGSERNNRLL